jgi:hypothetical protein
MQVGQTLSSANRAAEAAYSPQADQPVMSGSSAAE